MNIKKTLNPQNGEFIGKFFAALLNKIPTQEETGDALKGLSVLVEALFSPDVVKNFKRGLKLYTKENSAEVAKFISGIIKSASKGTEDTAKNLQAVSTFVKDLSSIGILSAATLKVVLGLMNEATGKSVASFVKSICSSMSDKNQKALKSFADSMKELSIGTLYMAGSIALITATISMFGIMNVIEAVTVSLAAVGGLMLLFGKISENQKLIQESAKSLMHISLMTTLLVANVAALVLLSQEADRLQWESIGKIAVLMTMMVGVTYVMTKLADTWKKNGKDMVLAMTGLATLMIGGALAVKLMVEVASDNNWKDILTGVAMIGAVIGLSAIMFKVLAANNKDLRDSLISLTVMTGLLMMTGYIINNLLIPIGEEAGPAALGVVITGLTLFALAGIVRMLNKIADPKKVLFATMSVAALSFMMIGISLIT